MGNVSKSFSLLLILVLAASSLMLAKPAFAQTATTQDTINTPPAGALIVPDEYPTIQDAVNNASAGDTVFVKDGTYYVGGVYGLYINIPLSLVGEDSRKTIIYSNAYASYGESSAIEIVTDHVTVTGFTLIGNGLGEYGINLENGNYSHQPSYCNIIGNNISNNSFAGISTREVSTGNVISENNITDNSSYGIYDESSDSIIAGNNISGNGGMGIIIDSSENVNVKQNVIANNGFSEKIAGGPITDQLGGLDLRWYGPYNIYENNITDNFGFGVQFGENCSNSMVYNNNILDNGVGVYVANFSFYPPQEDVGKGNKVYNNNIIDNHLNAFIDYAPIPNEYTEQVADIVSWDNGVVGNYWSDYQGHGAYVINQNNVDHHPLTQQVNISITAPTAPTLLSRLPIAIIAVVVVLIVVVSLLLYLRKRRIAFSQTKVTPPP